MSSESEESSGLLDSRSTPPNWEAVSEEIECPLCEYNLRGLVAPRCPECGFTFAWAELLEPGQRLHPFLFEHHPDRPVWSFYRTLTGGLRPWRFWRSIHPAQPCMPRRLAAYAIAIFLPVALIGASILGYSVMEWYTQNSLQRQWEAVYFSNPELAAEFEDEFRQYGGVNGYLDTYYPLSISGILRQHGGASELLAEYAMPSMLVGCWPIATLAALCVFEISRRRARVGRVHIVRAVVYSADVLWFLGLLYVVLVAVLTAARQGLLVAILPVGTSPLAPLTMLNLVALVVFNVRLAYAYSHYLRFPHAVGVVLSSQLIAGLVVFNLALIL